MMTQEWVVPVCEKVDLEEYDKKEFTKTDLTFALLKPLPGPLCVTAACQPRETREGSLNAGFSYLRGRLIHASN